MEIYTDASLQNEEEKGRFGVLLKNGNVDLGYALVEINNPDNRFINTSKLEGLGIELADFLKNKLPKFDSKKINIYSDQLHTDKSQIDFQHIASKHSGTSPSFCIHNLVKNRILTQKDEDNMVSKKTFEQMKEVVSGITDIKNTSNLDIIKTVSMLPNKFPLSNELLSTNNDTVLNKFIDNITKIKNNKPLLGSRVIKTLKLKVNEFSSDIYVHYDKNQGAISLKLNKKSKTILNVDDYDQKVLETKLKQDLNLSLEHFEEKTLLFQCDLTIELKPFLK